MSLVALVAAVVAAHEVLPRGIGESLLVAAALLLVLFEVNGHRLAAKNSALLAYTRESYRTLVETLPLVMYVDEVAPAARPRFISPQVEALLGYTPAEWHADPDLFWRLVHPDDAQRVREAHLALTDDGDAL